MTTHASQRDHATKNLSSADFHHWMSRLARNLRINRERKGLSQLDAAIAAGIALNTYARLERGASGRLPNPTLLTMVRIFSVLDLELFSPAQQAPPGSGEQSQNHERPADQSFRAEQGTSSPRYRHHVAQTGLEKSASLP